MKLIVSGGGTGGHIYPALAIADEFMKQHPEGEVLYVGKENSLEQELVEKTRYTFAPIHIEGLPRKVINKKTFLTFMSLLKVYVSAIKLLKSLNRMWL